MFRGQRSWWLCLAGLAALSSVGEAQRGAASSAPTEFRRRNTSPPVATAFDLGDAALDGALAPGDAFGRSVAPLGDFDGDGVPDLAVTAPGDAAGGAVWLLLLRSDGSVKGSRELTPASCGCTGPFVSVDRIGDLDGDGVTDLIVGSVDAALVLFLNDDGSVRAHARIASGSGGFAGPTPADFGISVTRLGDLDGDGTLDVAIGSTQGVVVLFLAADGSVRFQQEFRPGTGGFPLPTLTFPDSFGILFFGWTVDELGDFDGDGVQDLLVTGHEVIFEGGIGHLWIVLMNPDGTVASAIDHSSYSLGLWPIEQDCPFYFAGDGSFGYGAACVGDLDRDGVRDLAVARPYNWTCCLWTPSVLLLHLNADGSVKSVAEIGDGSAPHGLALEALDMFGRGLASPGDVDGDGWRDLAIGAPGRFGAPDEFCEEALDPLGLVWLLLQR
jgi:FG-GAP repeat protein/VCBS repeat protein